MFLSPHLPTDDPLALLDEAAGEDGSSDDSSESDSDEEEADAALFRSDELHNVVDPKPPDQPGKAVTPGKTLGPLPPPRELFNFGSANGSSDAMPLPPRMRTGYAMLYPPPVHRADEPPEPEPLVRNKKLDELVASLMAADAERLQNPALSRNRVAYDVFDPIDLKTNMFVRDDCLNQVLPAIDAPLGEAGLQAARAARAAPAVAGGPRRAWRHRRRRRRRSRRPCVSPRLRAATACNLSLASKAATCAARCRCRHLSTISF